MSLDSQAVLNEFGLLAPNLPRSPYKNVLRCAALDRWVPVLVWKMTTAEMAAWGVAGQTCCFQIFIDRAGKPITNPDELRRVVEVSYNWRANDPHIAPIEKVWPEPPANFAMGFGGKYTVSVSKASDIVHEITLPYPADKDDPNGHHATVIVWQWQVADAVVEPVQPEPAKPAHGYALVKLAALDEMLSSIDAHINALRAMRQEVASWRKP